MGMTAAYLQAKCEEIKEPIEGETYRVIGFNVEAAKYTVEEYDKRAGVIKFKGYGSWMPIGRLKFYEVEK